MLKDVKEERKVARICPLFRSSGSRLATDDGFLAE